MNAKRLFLFVWILAALLLTGCTGRAPRGGRLASAPARAPETVLSSAPPVSSAAEDVSSSGPVSKTAARAASIGRALPARTSAAPQASSRRAAVSQPPAVQTAAVYLAQYVDASRKIVPYPGSGEAYAGLYVYADGKIDEALVKSAYCDSTLENGVFALVNRERVSHGLRALRENATLAKSARRKAMDMMENHYFAHKDLQGKYFTDYLNAAGFRASLALENLVYYAMPNNYVATAQKMFLSWKASAPHYANILNGGATETGVGVCLAYAQGSWTLYAAQEFSSDSNL